MGFFCTCGVHDSCGCAGSIAYLLIDGYADLPAQQRQSLEQVAGAMFEAGDHDLMVVQVAQSGCDEDWYMRARIPAVRVQLHSGATHAQALRVLDTIRASLAAAIEASDALWRAYETYWNTVHGVEAAFHPNDVAVLLTAEQHGWRRFSGTPTLTAGPGEASWRAWVEQAEPGTLAAMRSFMGEPHWEG